MREAFYNRLKKNSAHRSKWARRQNIGAYRLYHHDIPEYPFIIDRYGDYVVIWERLREGLDESLVKDLPQIKAQLKELFQLSERHFIWKERLVQTRDQRYGKLTDRLYGEQELLVIPEGERRYYCNLWDYLDTGLFLDMRNQRERIQKVLRPQKLLNLFSYTCSVGVSAALAGASTLNIDLSKTYLDWGRANYSLNDIDLKRHQFMQGPCLEVLAQTPLDDFDLIFLDPPTFSNSKRTESDFEVERDQEELIEKAMRWLAPKGLLLFSTNKKKFKMSEKLTHDFLVKETTAQSVPEDFKNSAIHKSFEIRKR